MKDKLTIFFIGFLLLFYVQSRFPVKFRKKYFHELGIELETLN